MQQFCDMFGTITVPSCPDAEVSLEAFQNTRSLQRADRAAQEHASQVRMLQQQLQIATLKHQESVAQVAHFTGRLQSGMTQLNLPPPQHGQSHLAPMSDQMESKQHLIPSTPQDNMGFDAQLMESSIDQLLNDSNYTDLDEA